MPFPFEGCGTKLRSFVVAGLEYQFLLSNDHPND